MASWWSRVKEKAKSIKEKFKPTPKPSPAPEAGKLIVTKKEAQSISPSSRSSVKVVRDTGADRAGSLPPSSGGGGSSRSGGSSGPIDVSTGKPVVPEKGTLVTADSVSQAELNQQMRQDKIEMDKLNRQRQAEIARQKQIESAKGFGAFIDREGYEKGFVTSTGEFFPTQNRNFIPSGYVRGEISDFDSDTGSISLAFTEGARTPSLGERAPVDVATGQEQTPVLEKKQLDVIDGIPQVGFTVRTPWTGEEREVIPKKTDEGLVFDIGEDYEDVTIPTDTITLPPVQRRLPLVKLEDRIAKGFRKELDIVTTPLRLTEGGREFRERVMDFGEGAVRGVIPTSNKEIMQDAALYGLTFGIGAGFKLASVGGKALIKPLIGAAKTAKVSKITAKTFSIGGKGLLGLYGGSLGIQIARAETNLQRGEIFGKGVKDITIAIKGSQLGGRTVDTLRKPLIERVIIKEPVRTLKASEIIGRETISLKGKEQVLFDKQKILQFGSKGGRTEITQNWRKIFGLDKIYKGVPTDRKGYTTSKDLLREFGFTESQARATLRYNAPKFIESGISSGRLTIEGTKAKGWIEQVTQQRRVLVDKELGIKTRGGRTRIDRIDIERELFTPKTTTRAIVTDRGVQLIPKDLTYVKGTELRTTLLGKDLKNLQLIKTLSLGRAGEQAVIKGRGVFQDGTLKVTKDLTFRQIRSLTRSNVQRSLKPIKDITQFDYSKTTLFQDYTSRPTIKFTGIDTPTPRTTGGTITQRVSKLTQAPEFKFTAPTKVAGTITEVTMTKGLLGQDLGAIATTRVFREKDLMQDTIKVSRTTQKDRRATRTSQINLMKNLSKQDIATITGTAQGTRTAMKSATKQKNLMKSLLKTDTIKATRTARVGLAFTPSFRANFFKFKIPKVPTTKTPPFSFPKFDNIPEFRTTRKGKKGDEALIFQSDFTSRALGITKEVTQKELQKLALGESRAIGLRAIPILKNGKRRNNLSLIN